jgi:disulfide bond formation protein DsbB
MKRLTRILWLILFFGGIIFVLFFGLYDYLRGDIKGTFGLIQKLGVLIGIVLLLLAGHYAFKSFWRNLFLSFLALGAFLLGLNIYGEFVSLRSPKVNEGISHFNKFRKPQESYQQVFQQINKDQNESTEAYAYRLTELIYSATVHKWEDVVDDTEYNHQIPPHENYFLWVMSYLNPTTYRFYEYCDPYKAIERGVMICSQATEVMVQLWGNTGLEARDVVLDGHVVAEAQVDREKDIWWVLDADFGVVLEHDMNFLQGHTNTIVEKYVNAGYDLKTAKMVAEFYGPEGNYIQSNIGICRVEENLYKWKWYLPIGLLACPALYFGWAWLKERRLTAK